MSEAIDLYAWVKDLDRKVSGLEATTQRLAAQISAVGDTSDIERRLRILEVWRAERDGHRVVPRIIDLEDGQHEISGRLEAVEDHCRGEQPLGSEDEPTKDELVRTILDAVTDTEEDAEDALEKIRSGATLLDLGEMERQALSAHFGVTIDAGLRLADVHFAPADGEGSAWGSTSGASKFVGLSCENLDRACEIFRVLEVGPFAP